LIYHGDPLVFQLFLRHQPIQQIFPQFGGNDPITLLEMSITADLFWKARDAKNDRIDV
jgi:hypothetical protein